MTVIVWDGRTLAADKKLNYCGLGFAVTKLDMHNGLMWGCAGDTSRCNALSAWLRTGGEFPTDSGMATALVVEKTGRVVMYDYSPTPTVIEEPHFAIGSGADFALGAMFAGANAVTAVRAASAWSNTCGKGVDTLTFQET